MSTFIHSRAIATCKSVKNNIAKFLIVTESDDYKNAYCDLKFIVNVSLDTEETEFTDEKGNHDHDICADFDDQNDFCISFLIAFIESLETEGRYSDNDNLPVLNFEFEEELAA